MRSTYGLENISPDPLPRKSVVKNLFVCSARRAKDVPRRLGRRGCCTLGRGGAPPTGSTVIGMPGLAAVEKRKRKKHTCVVRLVLSRVHNDTVDNTPHSRACHGACSHRQPQEHDRAMWDAQQTSHCEFEKKKKRKCPLKSDQTSKQKEHVLTLRVLTFHIPVGCLTLHTKKNLWARTSCEHLMHKLANPMATLGRLPREHLRGRRTAQ